MERVMVFIDGSNFFWACRNRGIHNMVDHLKLVHFLVGSRSLVRPYYYCSVRVPLGDGQRKFIEKLRLMGFEVVTKDLIKRRARATVVRTGEIEEVEKETEKGVDVALVTDLLSMGYKNAYDTAIVVGADKDFEKAFREIKQIPRRLEIAAFSETASREIRMLADTFIPLENHVDKFIGR